MPPNPNKKNYRLADMSMPPDEAVPYPDPDETADFRTDRIEMAELGTILHVREWQGQDGLVEQFALMLNVTPAHAAYSRCQKLKGEQPNFEQVRRTDTWHSSVHSHQYFIDCSDSDRYVHEHLSGGVEEEKSRRVVHGTFQEHYYKMLYPFDYLECWEAGKP
ncbi:hypothetical protein CPHO_00510 [Corynebacterium phocae]|uniref:Uncharacterized protein n=1 Tax=Corynebacterium phocae TaxID=161895 RepID=A0A1L7D0I5_9CORY|nr:hypothetical protein [Corynebacterium phocae]APT91659.1 hypothetical protein CPHO_00510 [Corynebacterium phocae]KAA8728632.1 hypothetical protein F4V58_00065 [Corynebacterium phocae]